MNQQSSTLPRVIAFPKGDIAYNECLYAAAEREGMNVVDGTWAGRWLFNNVRHGDIVHVHWPSFLYYDPKSSRKKLRNLMRFFLRYAVMRIRGGRVVWTAHNLYPHDGGRKEWVHRLVRRFISRDAKAVVAHSPSARKALMAEFGIPSRKIFEVIHGHWIDYHPHTTNKAEAKRTLGIPADAYVYSIVGACKPYKNLEALIEAFTQLDANSFLLIAGQFQSREYRQKIDALLARIPPERYRLDAKFVANEDVQNYVLAADAFVLPYTDILTSGSAMLGLSFGVPVVAPDLGSMSDVINERCGLLYPPAMPNGLLSAMQAVRKRQFVAQDIVDYARTFDWTKSARALANCFRAIDP